MDALTVAQALFQAQARGLERLDAQLLLLHALGKSERERAWLLSHDTDQLPAAAQAALQAGVQRRACGEPLAYITGYKEFFGLALRVDQRVLVPRPDTETLVDWALAVLEAASVAQTPEATRALRALDLGTGSGAIALALKATRPALDVSALDFSFDALAVAQANAQRLGLALRLHQGSWLTALAQPLARFDLIVSNPPYIAAQDVHLAALIHEPLQALTSGADGLDDIRQIISQAPAHLNPGGWLLLEHGYDQAAKVRDLLLAAGFKEVQLRRDLNGIERCSGGRLAPG
ncbi:MAG: peptide chain release factor N(5)-glutamine methyltransferase [Gammaproteobacteria bacterium]|uniref:peptide chain release factor N(5)-glutamine methyltransferase n=1 Tax=Rhodoferax sp. TaxID=50421 RepID=UPI0017E1B8D0|nr:peptide chain release factor N(5)-glutamine methyltransferase [Rhodoferax sp.]MBU3897404.1 peptide chain release factor N(5)-glutamine methyltransferase [Gammaproteobacteria bacterium]MBA3057136.1 peptide chain release factor N(5)-glutamine methyltransferase [Rhodoferax sp.]MBU3999283.1 peptide chain release factor N(5)-glutamine methyltransferase [Gammaproteobacteria bacterium]MBU4018750.1 peptide chain release factor N(5)-glutamine methyltransferase [Gammaproteobacteria bacterium]MBU40797